MRCVDVETIARGYLTIALARCGVEVAQPIQDLGIDLLAYVGRDTADDRFQAWPIQLKANYNEGFSIDKKYADIPSLLIVFAWHLESEASAEFYLLSYMQAEQLADRMGWAWRAGGRWVVDAALEESTSGAASVQGRADRVARTIIRVRSEGKPAMTPPLDSAVARAYVDVDGFNFCEATKYTEAYSYGWCDWRLTAQNYCGRSRRVSGLKYFTSLISTDDQEKRRRQDLHIAAMRTIGKVVLGRLVQRQRTCKSCGSVEHFHREKKTDTNIAVHMVLDAAMDRYDEAFLVTADMDLLPAVEAVIDPTFLPKPRRVTVLFPPHADTSREFEEALDSFGAARVRPIEMRSANIVRFPTELAAKLGYPFPEHWALGSTGPPMSPRRPIVRSTDQRGDRRR